MSVLERERSGRGTPLDHLSDMAMILGFSGGCDLGKLVNWGFQGAVSTDNIVFFFFFLFCG